LSWPGSQGIRRAHLVGIGVIILALVIGYGLVTDKFTRQSN
jgi:hypothetical protein